MIYIYIWLWGLWGILQQWQTLGSTKNDLEIWCGGEAKFLEIPSLRKICRFGVHTDLLVNQCQLTVYRLAVLLDS